MGEMSESKQNPSSIRPLNTDRHGHGGLSWVKGCQAATSEKEPSDLLGKHL